MTHDYTKMPIDRLRDRRSQFLFLCELGCNWPDKLLNEMRDEVRAIETELTARNEVLLLDKP